MQNYVDIFKMSSAKNRPGSGREELNRFVSLLSATESVILIWQSPDLLPLFWSIFNLQVGFSFIQYIALRSVQN
jgi:hypothetical protein